jgi:chromosome segregation ATPase
MRRCKHVRPRCRCGDAGCRRHERNLERLKIERERLGAVNLRAEEEQTELIRAARNLIVKERDDIIDAIRELRAAIASLNREGRERLLEAFDIVNAHFSVCSPISSAAARPICS